MVKKEKKFVSEARSWAAKKGLHGPQAFLRYVMFVFIGQLNKASNDFIFKGGNLLWLYIQTPRATIDIDFATQSISIDKSAKEALEQACSLPCDKPVQFSVYAFRSIVGKGASATISYMTAEGQANSFDLDIVYTIPTHSVAISSPIDDQPKIIAASLENIIADKIAACHQFKGGNTRMKDFDDLWRIAQYDPGKVNRKALQEIQRERSIPLQLNESWVSVEMERNWKSHLRRN